jgi:sugar/nucleoside kinase (ribokinase family)
MDKRGLFVGLITGDLIYLAAHVPAANEKAVASQYCFAAGGPATNAAIAFRAQGCESRLVGALGIGSLGQLLGREIKKYGVEVIDTQAESALDPPISSIIVTKATGDRSVISLNTMGFSGVEQSCSMRFLDDIDVVLVDGHLMKLGAAIAREAQKRGIPVVVDGGSWKQNFSEVLVYSDFVICSANFYPPNCITTSAVVAYLQDLGVKNIAITQGQAPILWWQGDHQGEIPVPQVKVVDTLGAGDIFHGAFCAYILEQDFVNALASAAEVASYACQFFGTRAWLTGDTARVNEPITDL